MRHQGKISEWNDARGFGFIVPFEPGEVVFVHISSFEVRGRRPSPKEIVSYAIVLDDRGRPRADDVRYVLKDREPAFGSFPLIAGGIAFGFLALVVIASMAGRLWWPVACVYAVMSLVAYSAYKRDKLAAQQGAWRTREWTLIMLGLIGGWPGALLAQHRFRHKTRKMVFQTGYWISVAANLTALAILLVKQ